MSRYIKHILLVLLAAIVAVGCNKDEAGIDGALSGNGNGEIPIVFDCSLAGTRGFEEGDDVKTAFKSGDVIHVLGTFKTRYIDENGEIEINGEHYTEGVMTRYGVLSYNGKDWSTPNSTLTWPSIAISGTFKAYYISDSNGALTNVDPTQTYPLSDVTPSTDPLEAQSAADIGYGHAVQLNFKHMCAYLTLVDLEPMVATKYWFHRPNINDGETFNNGFKIALSEGEYGPELDFEFCQIVDTVYDKIYISADAIETHTYDENGIESVITKANYFLEPGYYDTFSLCYPATGKTTYDYLKYDYNNVPEDVRGPGTSNTQPLLEANTTYTLTITKAPGVTIVTPPSVDDWDDGEYHILVDVEEFLKAVHDGREYHETVDGVDVEILESTANGSRLLRNVDFHRFDYKDIKTEGFQPNIEEGSVFDGDHHYIRNLACPLFRYNYGTIKNLGITDILLNATSYEDADGKKDMSRHGALCMWNRSNATISNIRVTKVDMTVSVKAEIDANDDGSETHNIGGVIGSNSGTVDQVALSGDFKITVNGADDQVNASVLIGGIAGQNAGAGNIYDVSPLTDDLTISIVNTCKGDLGSYSLGGIVGESSGYITGVILPKVTVDGSQSSGVTSYMGGMAGQLNVSNNSTASIKSCIVSGKVTAGTTVQFGDITGGSYIGGIAGANLGVDVVDCRSAVSVYGSADAREQVLYATGGAFGRIREAANGIYNFENIIAYGSALQAPSGASAVETNYTGNFAGIVPKGQEWSDYANKNIIVHAFPGFSEIGKALDSNNNE